MLILWFCSSFDDTTDVNPFGPANDAGWLNAAESRRRTQVLMKCEFIDVLYQDDAEEAKSRGKVTRG